MATFVFDLDGTICFGGGQIDPIILAALTNIPSTHKVVIASARHPINIRDSISDPLFTHWDIVGANGAIAHSDGGLIHAAMLGARQAKTALDTLDGTQCAYFAYGADFVFVSRYAHMLNPKIHSKAANKLRLGSSSDLAQIIKILVLPKINDLTSLRLCEGLSDLSVQPHSDGTFDLMPVGVDKTTGLRALGHALPVFAAFGNDANDLAMLRAARHSVCIGNHHDVQLVASQIIHSGPRQPERIARAINRLIQKAGAGILSHGVGQIMEAGR